MYIKYFIVSFIAIILFLGCGSTVNRDVEGIITDEDQFTSEENIDKNRAELYTQGEVIFKDKCEGCHGSYGEKKALGKSVIANMQEHELIEAMRGYKSGTRNNYNMGALMKGQVGNLSDEELTSLGVYIYDLNKERLTLAGKGHKLYVLKYEESCGMSSNDFASQKSQSEWTKTDDTGTFIDELQEICPNVTFKKLYEKYLYAFVYRYASDSGNIVSE
ncbi:MAG: hypothetical protein K0U47_05585 [Epsilonproteobacteria bacterium]|nr:hypothetical protein [Campylobacterota bacterium]